jgi:8-oxo-dGTP pyrophosphatase MutT (NUDIX family)
MIGPGDSVWKQAAAIPYRVRKGRLEIALVTSSSGKRWVLPKGCIDPGERAWEAAARETEEEAGLRGKIERLPVGRYDYGKWGATCEVEVFLMRVSEVLDRWPEVGLRDRDWFTLKEAVAEIREADLRRILRDAPYRSRGATKPSKT